MTGTSVRNQRTDTLLAIGTLKSHTLIALPPQTKTKTKTKTKTIR